VTTYEVDAEFAEVARGNMVTAGVADRVEVRTGDLTEELDALADEGSFDVLTLDTGDAPEVVERADDLASGGTSPSTPRSSRGPARPPSPPPEAGFEGVETLETIQRRWTSPTAAPAPRPRASGHTGYLVFGRAP